ncbi:hypothetical protein [Asticcacaulis sp. YBE204]|uniref:hypothetical protein n=1 Tax=Asticcacaulis sp. YBE204 TaxID=1282363 RepID=UPI0003C3F419|nr:hypothetical protein [Asticcacaulis sp. YBE204]ESQ79841.1 hypothetical protein AEYBE204_08325 [Asticcacaulis sp. YBE204]
MKRIVMTALFALAASHTQAAEIGRVTTNEIKAASIDGCSAYLYRSESDIGKDSTAVWVDDFEKGLIRVDGKLIPLTLTGASKSMQTPESRFASADGAVVVTQSLKVTKTISDEVFRIAGTLTVEQGAHRDTIKVVGETGC